MKILTSRAAAVVAGDRPYRHRCLQIALALAAPSGQASWGGANTHLPAGLRVGSALSAAEPTWQNRP
jgi:hypothetical protein